MAPVHAGAAPDPSTGARVTPIYQTTSYVFNDVDHAASLFGLEAFGNIYTRIGGPTQSVLEQRIAALEGGTAALAVASGHAAQMIVFHTLLEAGDEFVAGRQLYGGSVNQFNHSFKRFNWKVAWADSTDPESFQKAITPKTRLFILNSPSNPTGAAYTAAELRALGDVLVKHPQVIICTDDMYEHIYWAKEPFVSLAQVCPELYDRVVTTNGVSKAYAMTGWRIGYCGGPIELVTAMSTIQSQSTSNPSSIAQKAAVSALNGDQECVREMNKSFKQRHDFVVAGLNKLPGVTCLEAAGTFYAFAHVEKAMQILGVKDDNAFAEHLLIHGGVAVVPGGGFGAPNHMRISFATSMKNLEEALKRMERTLRAAQAA